MALVQTMVDLRYLRMDDVPKIPKRETPFRTAVYAPLAAAPAVPDVVLVCGTAQQLMLLTEAAELAGVAITAPAMGRPTCAMLPQAINTGRPAVSFGCVGNRVYTGADASQAYVAIPGSQIEALQQCLAVIVAANDQLELFHRNRAVGSA
jgi:uncharacterized protein (DUF169 family)